MNHLRFELVTFEVVGVPNTITTIVVVVSFNKSDCALLEILAFHHYLCMLDLLNPFDIYLCFDVSSNDSILDSSKNLFSTKNQYKYPIAEFKKK